MQAWTLYALDLAKKLPLARHGSQVTAIFESVHICVRVNIESKAVFGGKCAPKTPIFMVLLHMSLPGDKKMKGGCEKPFWCLATARLAIHPFRKSKTLKAEFLDPNKNFNILSNILTNISRLARAKI